VCKLQGIHELGHCMNGILYLQVYRNIMHRRCTTAYDPERVRRYRWRREEVSSSRTGLHGGEPRFSCPSIPSLPCCTIYLIYRLRAPSIFVRQQYLYILYISSSWALVYARAHLLYGFFYTGRLAMASISSKNSSRARLRTSMSVLAGGASLFI
jgi:hypothetical protein